MRLRDLALAGLFLAGCATPRPAPAPEFAGLVDTLSEPGGFFDSDNLVSNETAYLHVMGGLRDRQVKGGVFLGVGPDQNFSYIAEIEPEMALVIDIRRDNLLLHLLYKAIFEATGTRIEFLSQLFGRTPPPDPSSWSGRDLATLLDYVDSMPLHSAAHDSVHRFLLQRIDGFGVPLSAQDRATIRRFHDEFATAGLRLTFATLGRPPQRDYPTVRRLYQETDLEGIPASFLATEERWRRVRDLQRADRIIPVVGDMGGTGAMRAISSYLKETGRRVSAFYVSNVEFYLIRAGTFPTFVESVRAMPAEPSAVLIRSWFNRGFGSSSIRPGHFSSQHLQTFSRFLDLAEDPQGLRYDDLVFDSVAVRR